MRLSRKKFKRIVISRNLCMFAARIWKEKIIKNILTMKILNLFFSVICAVSLLAAGQLYGQDRIDKGAVMPPVKGDDMKGLASELNREGWKTDRYSIEEQLVSTAKLKGEMNKQTHDALYLWVQEESSGSNLQEVKEKNYISGINRLSYQVELLFLSQCRLSLMQRNGTAEQIAAMEKIIVHVAPQVVQNECRKSMEIHRSQDEQVAIRSVYMVDKSKVYDNLCNECIKHAESDKKNAILTDVFKEALNRMAKQSLR